MCTNDTVKCPFWLILPDSSTCEVIPTGWGVDTSRTPRLPVPVALFLCCPLHPRLGQPQDCFSSLWVSVHPVELSINETMHMYPPSLPCDGEVTCQLRLPGAPRTWSLLPGRQLCAVMRTETCQSQPATPSLGDLGQRRRLPKPQLSHLQNETDPSAAKGWGAHEMGPALQAASIHPPTRRAHLSFLPGMWARHPVPRSAGLCPAHACGPPLLWGMTPQAGEGPPTLASAMLPASVCLQDSKLTTASSCDVHPPSCFVSLRSPWVSVPGGCLSVYTHPPLPGPQPAPCPLPTPLPTPLLANAEPSTEPRHHTPVIGAPLRHPGACHVSGFKGKIRCKCTT